MMFLVRPARRLMTGAVAAGLFICLAAACASAADSAAAGGVDFVRDIQPIFQKSCYQCHDSAKHKGGMRLDSKATAFIGGDSGELSIVPKDPDKSKLIQLVRGDDPAAVMPPKGKRLSVEQIGLLVRWVKDGASWPDGIDHPGAALTHWSFTKPVRPAVPEVKEQAWLHNPIDNFILARLQKEGLTHSPPADRYTLVRRLSLDLIGIPPSPHEVAEFVSDQAPDAYEKLVDRLLANPHFGEKWARQWLDLGRYADSSGYGSDPLRYTTYRWRDWLIDALNRNERYDQFTIEQIAGDLLPHPTEDQLIATAFNRNTMTNTEGGTDPEEYRVEAVKDRTDTTVQTWMGLTMGCAKCHTHKYDPITNREYYQVFAIFNQTEDANRADEAPTIPTPTKEQQHQIDSFKRQIADVQAKLNDPAAWAAEQSQWEKTLVVHQPKWQVLSPLSAESKNGATLTVQPDGSVLAAGKRPETDTYSIAADTDLKGITAFRLEVLPDSSQPHGGTGRHENGGFVLSHFGVQVVRDKVSPISGRYVRVELPGKKKFLSLAEVQVLSGGENVAPKGKATQSSTDFGGEARLAIDGNTDGDYSRAHSISHTAESDDPWWELDLGESHDLQKLLLWNRTDGGFGSRLSDFRVIVLNDKHEPVWDTTIASPPNPSLEIDPNGPRRIKLTDASDSFHQTEGGQWSADKAIGAHTGASSGWAVSPQVDRAHSAVFQTKHDVVLEPGAHLSFTLSQDFPNAPIGRLRLSATTSLRPVRALPEDIADALALAPEARSADQKAGLFKYFVAVAPQPQALRGQIAKLNKELEQVKPAVTAVMRELPPDKRREDHVLIKGNFLAKGPIVQPGVPAAFNPLPSGAPADRLGLAHWIVDKDNPLTARVEVNRLWAQLFGAGIVETQEDFGTQGQPPSNQALLDWLACEFQSSGWDVKHMIKLMVMSAAYQQSSHVNAALAAADPKNRLITRGPSHRLEAEFVRDQALAISGLLSPKMYGPSIYPPQPDGLWQVAFNGEHTWATSTGEDRYRRGIYVFWRRTIPYPSMAAFDAPSREVCTLRRIQTSTPLQAFVTLNDPVYVECSQALARRIIQEGGATTDELAKWALELCLCRPPQPREIERVVALYNHELERYQKDEKAATELATSERGALPAGVSAPDAAAWTVCSNVLLNMDGVLTKR